MKCVCLRVCVRPIFDSVQIPVKLCALQYASTHQRVEYAVFDYERKKIKAVERALHSL